LYYIPVYYCITVLGGESVPVGNAPDENKHFEEAKRENYRRHGPRAEGSIAPINQ
jgi:hypothetical protein